MYKTRGVVLTDSLKPIYEFQPKYYYKNRVEELHDYRTRRYCSGISATNILETKDLIKYLTYWDKIDYSKNNFISTYREDPDFLLLKEQGILIQTTYYPDFLCMSNAPEILLKSQLFAYESHQSNIDEHWTIAQDIADLYFPTENAEINSIIEFNLYNNLPVPIDTTPIHEILDFKDRRKDELQQLRIHLDNIYNDIIGAEKIQQEYQKKVGEISKDLYNLNRLFREHKIKTRIDSLKSYFRNPKETISDILLPTSIVPLITSNMPTLAPYMPSVGMQLAAGAIIAFTSKKMRTPVHNSSLTEISPFAYTFQMGKEFQTR